MAELDLIPFGYRQEMLVRYWLKIFALLYVFLLACIGASKYILHAQTAEMENQVSTFELNRKEVNRKQHILNELEQEKKDLINQARVKNRLQGGLSAQQMFLIMDRALDKSTWFKRWVYQRAEKFSELESAAQQFSLVVPTGNNKSKSQASNFATTMEIAGQAISHTKLAILVHNLASQPEIEDVKVVKTSQGKSRSTEVLDFNLAIKLRD